jgi:ubiquitin-like protein Pup
MAEQERKQTTSEPVEHETTDAEPQVSDQTEDITERIDDLLEEIDSVLEENAEEFVKNYVQKGGE